MKRWTPRFAGWMPPMGLTALVIIVLAVLSGTTRRIAFVVSEGATGAMRIRWPWWRAFLVSLGDWAALIPLYLGIVWLVRHNPMDKDRWRRSLVHHVLGILVLVPLGLLARQVVFALTTLLVAGWGETRDLFRQLSWPSRATSAYQILFLYVVMAAILYAVEFRRQRIEKEHQALKLERQLAQAQLQMLRMQLNPHFLFNTLNALGSLMRKDVERADEMLMALTDFLRSTLKAHGTMETPLERELELARCYVDIEQIRFPDRIKLTVDAEPETLNVPVPSFLLQPLVENAVRHGLAPRASGGDIWIQARLVHGILQIQVLDDGLGREAPSTEGHGIGLGNTRERLAQHYGGHASMEAGPRQEGGFCVSLHIPVLRGPVSELS